MNRRSSDDNTIIIVAIVVISIVVIGVVFACFACLYILSVPIETEEPLQANLQIDNSSTNSTIATIIVNLTNPRESNLSHVFIILVDADGYTADAHLYNGTAYIDIQEKTYVVKFIDVTGSGTLQSGDKIKIDGGSNSVRGMEFTLFMGGYEGRTSIRIP